jgi:hypothetical protein
VAALLIGCLPTAPNAEAPLERTVAALATSPAPSIEATTDAAGTATVSGPRVTFVGALELEPSKQTTHADLIAYNNLAIVGSRCGGPGARIIDITNPSAPTLLSIAKGDPIVSMEDVNVVRIGTRDVLAAGLQECTGNPSATAGRVGLQLFDITDPRKPSELALFPTEYGVHEFDLTVTPDGRTLGLLAAPDPRSSSSARAQDRAPQDFVIVDITDPSKPQQKLRWGIGDEPTLGDDFARQAQQGSMPVTLLHSARANADGTRAYLSYWDAGVIMLDISDPSKPIYLGRTTFATGDEGNAHSVVDTNGGKLLIQADEDFSASSVTLTSSAFTGDRRIDELDFTPTPSISGLNGETVSLGRGCVQDSYPTDPSGKVAVIERGECGLGLKIVLAQEAGATGVIIYDSDDQPENEIDVNENGAVELSDGSRVTLSINAFFVERETGQALIAGAAQAEVDISERFDGWGYLRLFDITDPANPKPLSTFATPNTTDENAEPGMWTVHNPEIDGDLLYASWYSDGVRVIDIADPSAPRELASWTGAGAPSDEQMSIWSVVPHNGLLLASDMEFGLYILKFEP